MKDHYKREGASGSNHQWPFPKLAVIIFYSCRLIYCGVYWGTGSWYETWWDSILFVFIDADDMVENGDLFFDFDCSLQLSLINYWLDVPFQNCSFCKFVLICSFNVCKQRTLINSVGIQFHCSGWARKGRPTNLAVVWVDQLVSSIGWPSWKSYRFYVNQLVVVDQVWGKLGSRIGGLVACFIYWHWIEMMRGEEAWARVCALVGGFIGIVEGIPSRLVRY